MVLKFTGFKYHKDTEANSSLLQLACCDPSQLIGHGCKTCYGWQLHFCTDQVIKWWERKIVSIGTELSLWWCMVDGCRAGFKTQNKTKTMGLDEIWDENFDSDCVYVTRIVWIVCRWTLFQQLFPVTKTSTVKRTTSLLTVSCNIPNGFITLLSACWVRIWPSFRS